MSTTNDFLMGGGGASAKFDQIGDTITGRITATEVRQQTSLEDGKPLTWDNGDPRMQLVVTLATDLHDDADDDGARNLYVKGSKTPGSKSLHDAVRAAVQNAKAKGLEVGGTLTVSYVGDEPSKTRGFNPRKLYQATYAAPDKAAETGGFLGTTTVTEPAAPAAPAATTPAQPVTPPPAAAPAGDTPADKAKALIALGLDDTTIATATSLDPSVVALLRAA